MSFEGPPGEEETLIVLAEPEAPEAVQEPEPAEDVAKEPQQEEPQQEEPQREEPQREEQPEEPVAEAEAPVDAKEEALEPPQPSEPADQPVPTVPEVTPSAEEGKEQGPGLSSTSSATAAW